MNDRSRFVLKNGALFGVTVGPAWLLMMRLLAKDIDFSWPNVLLILAIWAAAGFLWTLVMWSYLQRRRKRARAYYAELQNEMVVGGAAGSPQSEGGPDFRPISIVLTPLTIAENVRVAIVTLYGRPLAALRNCALPVVLSACTFLTFESPRNLLDGNVWATIKEILGLIVLIAMFGGTLLFLVASALRRTQRKAWGPSASVSVTLGNAGLQIASASLPASTIPWSAIDAAGVLGGIVVFRRSKRILMAFPANRFGSRDREQLNILLQWARSGRGGARK